MISDRLSALLGAVLIFVVSCGEAAELEPKPVGSVTHSSDDLKPKETERGIEKIWSIKATDKETAGAAAQTIKEAEQRLSAFARQHGLEAFVPDIEAQELAVYPSKKAFDTFLRDSNRWPSDQQIPETIIALYAYSAIHVVEESAALENDDRLTGHQDYVGVLTHELAHGLHIAVGRAHQISYGPVWFREGFAIMAASLFENDPISDVDFRFVLNGKAERDYDLYGAAFRRLADQRPVLELLLKADSPEFKEWALVVGGLGVSDEQ
ncbi:MAG: hypothetical protein CMK07_14610 [Ponticaulis sp.]|nr:hypothetical protein [Ponticaulis sp.]